MHGITGNHAAFQRQHDAAAENGIEEGIGIPHEQQARRRAILRMPRVLARDPVFARGGALGEVISIHLFSLISRSNIAFGSFTPSRLKYLPSATTPTLTMSSCIGMCQNQPLSGTKRDRRRAFVDAASRFEPL
jgi:hypothetical protein